jgi:SAM-dependent methyltransferase
LLRSDPIVDLNLSDLYAKSKFDYSSELIGLKKTYMKLLLNALDEARSFRSIFEIGGGNGFFLEAAKDVGFDTVAGIEPSIAAINAAREDIKPNLIASIMKDGVLPGNSFQVGVMFHTLDHLPDPLDTLVASINALEPGGKFLVAVHNERSWSARLLAKRSPIIDVEHTYLYSFKTGFQMFKQAGFVDVKVGTYWNYYSLAYILHLLPISRNFRKWVLSSSLGIFLRKFRIMIPLGNMWISGVKP